MSDYEIIGRCPGALRPMLSGDGLIVRVRPRGGCLTAAQAQGLAKAARTFGNGIIDLSSRANLQIRGVSVARHGALLEVLGRLGLLDADANLEAQRNVIVAPFWDAAGLVPTVARQLEEALADADLALPGKFGFAVDCGDELVLGDVSADVRIERGCRGQLIVRADGAIHGRDVAPADAAPVALALARWFVDTGGVSDGRGRMVDHLQRGETLPSALAGSSLPVPNAQRPVPGPRLGGALVGIAFGSMPADVLEALAQHGQNLRMTPWRMLFLPGTDVMPEGAELVTNGDDPILRVEACPGAPRCRQGQAATRPLARRLAPCVPAGAVLHIAGCAKGCACPRPTALTLVATADGFDVVRDGTASASPVARGLSADELSRSLAQFIGGRDGLQL